MADQDSRPDFHCSCSVPLVSLRAEGGPEDEADPRPAPPNPRGRVVMGMAVLLVITGLAVFFFGWPGTRPAPEPAAAAQDRTDLGESLDAAQTLVEQAMEFSADPGAVPDRGEAGKNRRRTGQTGGW
jgi:hypothetical protein